MKLFVFLVVLVALLVYLRTLRRPRQESAHTPPSAARRGLLSRAEALAILGLDESATQDEIIATHRKLMQRVHPDKGGSAKLAQQLNDAKRSLLARN